MKQDNEFDLFKNAKDFLRNHKKTINDSEKEIENCLNPSIKEAEIDKLDLSSNIVDGNVVSNSEEMFDYWDEPINRAIRILKTNPNSIDNDIHSEHRQGENVNSSDTYPSNSNKIVGYVDNDLVNSDNSIKLPLSEYINPLNPDTSLIENSVNFQKGESPLVNINIEKLDKTDSIQKLEGDNKVFEIEDDFEHTLLNNENLSSEIFNKDNQFVNNTLSNTVHPNNSSNNGEISNRPNNNISSHSSKERKQKIHNHDLAKLLIESFKMAIIDNNLFYANEKAGYYMNIDGDNFDKFIRKNIPEKYKFYIHSNTSQEIYKWIINSDIEKVSEEDLNRRKSYVAFSNCIVDINDFSVHSHDPSYYFTSLVNTKYFKNIIKQDNYFERFINQITQGNEKLYLRLQELFGYVISEIRDVKYIPFLLGPKDSGKSIILKLLEYLIGRDFVSNLSLNEFNNQNYLSKLLGKKLNTCGETSELSLNRLDTIKKISGGDYVTARFLYDHPFEFINRAVLLFAGNHLPTIKGIDRSNAFGQRLVIFPFNYPVPKEKQDPYLFDKLINETPYIAKWALIGLNRWHNNNYQFTSCEPIETIMKNYYEETNSIESFIKTSCILDFNSKTQSNTLVEGYNLYCEEIGISAESEKFFHKYLKSISTLRYSKFRVDGILKYGYKGIKLKEELENTVLNH